MVLLSLLRHAKSDWSRGIRSDHERPLAPRGKKAAPRIGRYIEASGQAPDTILCSTALRTRQTVDLLLPELSTRPSVHYLENLYHADPRAMLAILRKLPPDCRHAMIVGHNPGLEELALALCEDDCSPRAREMAAKFPTGALALYQFDGNWPDLREKSARLLAFVTPRKLPER